MINNKMRVKALTYCTTIFPGIVLVLSLISATGICKGSCSALSDYRLFGVDFAVTGIAYSLLLLVAGWFANKDYRAGWAVNILIASGIGAEFWFIAIQKNEVKQWCPICLSIAAILFLFGISRLISSQHTSVSAAQRKKTILCFAGTVAVLLSMATGYSVAIISVTSQKVVLTDQAKKLDVGTAAGTTQNNIPASTTFPYGVEDIWFGLPDSRFLVVFVSDWYCDFCRSLEPTIEKMLPEIFVENTFLILG